MTSVTFSYPMKLRECMHVALLFRRCAFQTNMSESTCVVVECYEDSWFFFFTVFIFSMTEIEPVSVFIVFWVFFLFHLKPYECIYIVTWKKFDNGFKCFSSFTTLSLSLSYLSSTCNIIHNMGNVL